MLEDPRVRSLTVVEALGEVIRWHERGLLPDAQLLTLIRGSRVVNDNSFALVDGASGFDP